MITNECKVCGQRIDLTQHICSTCHDQLMLAADKFCDLSGESTLVDILENDDGYNVVEIGYVICHKSGTYMFTPDEDRRLAASRRPYPAVASPCGDFDVPVSCGRREITDLLAFDDQEMDEDVVTQE